MIYVSLPKSCFLSWVIYMQCMLLVIGNMSDQSFFSFLLFFWCVWKRGEMIQVISLIRWFLALYWLGRNRKAELNAIWLNRIETSWYSKLLPTRARFATFPDCKRTIEWNYLTYLVPDYILNIRFSYTYLLFTYKDVFLEVGGLLQI